MVHFSWYCIFSAVGSFVVLLVTTKFQGVKGQLSGFSPSGCIIDLCIYDHFFVCMCGNGPILGPFMALEYDLVK